MSSRDQNSFLYIRVIQGHTGGKIVASELLDHIDIPYNWNIFIFSQEVLSIVLQFSSQDSLLEGEQAKMDDKQFSSHLSIRHLRMNQEKF